MSKWSVYGGGQRIFFFLVYKRTMVSHPAIQNEVMIYFNHCIYLEIFITSIYYSFFFNLLKDICFTFFSLGPKILKEIVY
jgi:hypothetical protein